eukprot:362800-Chlamydomonas_euryale.AAC.1
MRVYASTLADTIGAHAGRISEGKSARKPVSTADKMVRIAVSLGGGTHSIVKWRVKRGVISWRPPPGGAHAATSVVSSTSFHHSFLRS